MNVVFTGLKVETGLGHTFYPCMIQSDRLCSCPRIGKLCAQKSPDLVAYVANRRDEQSPDLVYFSCYELNN